jgi:hypothetical protein
VDHDGIPVELLENSGTHGSGPFVKHRNGSGTFDIYGDLSAHGSYSGQNDVSTTSTIIYAETVSVPFSIDHCFIDVVRTFGPTVRGDIENKRPAPPSVFGFEARRGDPTASFGFGIAALTQEPTAHALQSALKYITSVDRIQ